MKVILTESQLQIIKEDAIAEMICESFVTETSFKKMLDKIKAGLVAGISATAMIIAIQKADISNSTKQQLIDFIKTGQQVDSTFDKKVQAVKDYMAYAAKNVKYNPDDIEISPEEMVNACNTTNFDLPLLMAQAHMESCFGLTPRARKTNSVFSVGSYDNGKNIVTYPTQNASIMPYIKLMQNDYLNGKTVDDILKPGQFVNYDKKRYASNKNYENSVNNIRNRILTMYPILGQ